MKVEEDPWPGFNQVGTKISISEDGPWKKSKKGCTREGCHEGTKKRMSPFLAVMNNFHERGGRYNLETEVVKRFRLEAESRWRGLFEGVGGSATNGSMSLITLSSRKAKKESTQCVTVGLANGKVIKGRLHQGLSLSPSLPPPLPPPQPQPVSLHFTFYKKRFIKKTLFYL